MKKRTFKRVASGIAALAMVATLAVPFSAMLTATAYDKKPHQIVFENQNGTSTSHTYEVYKIFEGIVDPTNIDDEVGVGVDGFGRKTKKELTEISWAMDEANGMALIAALQDMDDVWFNVEVPDETLGALKANSKQPEKDAGEADDHPEGNTFKEIFAQADSAASLAKIIGLYSNDAEITKALSQFFAEHTNLLKKVEMNPVETGDTDVALTFADATSDSPCKHDGYYIIVEKALGVTDGDVSTTTVHLLGVYDASEGVKITLKASLPSFEKKVMDVNDSKATNTSDEGEKNPSPWQDTADYDIGDYVPFQLKATLPSTYLDYEDYILIFHDDLNKSADVDVFEFNADSLFAYLDVNGNGIYDTGDVLFDVSKGDYELTAPVNECTDKGKSPDKAGNTSPSPWDCDIEVKFPNLKASSIASDIAKALGSDVPSIKGTAMPKIIVEYTAKLKDTANIGQGGNWNDAYIQYSNNPNSTGEGNLSETEKDTVGVYTYVTVIEKTDAEGNALNGAGFTLYKYIENPPVPNRIGSNEPSEPNYNPFYGDEHWFPVYYDFTLLEPDADNAKDGQGNLTYKTAGGEYNYTDNNPQNLAQYEKTGVGSEGTKLQEPGADNNYFFFKGLDGGRYMLLETTVPKGYNEPEVYYFEIDAEHDAVSTDGSTDHNKMALTKLWCYVTDKEGRYTELVSAGGTVNPGDRKGWGAVDLSAGKISNTIENHSGAVLPGTGGIGTTLFYVIGGTLVVGAGVTLITKKRMQKEAE